MTIKLSGNLGQLANLGHAGSLAALGGDLFSASKPGLTPALLQAIQVMAGGGSPIDAASSALSFFATTPAGKAAGSKALKALGPILNEVVKRPLLAGQWGKLTAFVAKPSTFKPVTDLLVKSLGKEAGTALSSFTRNVLHTATSKGFEQAIKAATKGAPKVLAIIGKLGKLVPFVGLAASLISSLKTFANPEATAGQKAAALLDLASGVVGVIPGVGTGAQLVLGVVSTAASFAADAAAARNPVDLSSQRNWQSSSGGDVWETAV